MADMLDSKLSPRWKICGTIEFFKAEASRFDQPDASVNDRLTAKHHQRAALLMLVFYFEGVLNRWLQTLLSKAEFEAVERKPIEFKIEKISQHTDAAPHSASKH